MNLSPLIYDRKGEVCAVRLLRGPGADKTYAVDLLECTNPLCTCQEIILRCTDPNEKPAAHSMRVDIVLDLSRRSVTHSTFHKISKMEASTLAQELAIELSVEDWGDLYRRFYKLKEAQTDNADCSRLSADFPPEVLSEPSLMVAYKEVFPWGKTFDFTLDRECWLIDDQHCVNPACDCQDALITFCRVAFTQDGKPEVAHDSPTARYDANRAAFEALNPPWPDKPALETLARALRVAHPTFDEAMRNRRRQLRTLYESAIKRERPKAPPPRVQRQDVGPNDRCPCGSGRKYKKCCGRLAQK